MKIIAVDNLNRDTIDDVLVESDMTEAAAMARVARRNNDPGVDSAWVWQVVPDDHVLHVWTP